MVCMDAWGASRPKICTQIRTQPLLCLLLQISGLWSPSSTLHCPSPFSTLSPPFFSQCRIFRHWLFLSYCSTFCFSLFFIFRLSKSMCWHPWFWFPILRLVSEAYIRVHLHFKICTLMRKTKVILLNSLPLLVTKKEVTVQNLSSMDIEILSLDCCEILKLLNA